MKRTRIYIYLLLVLTLFSCSDSDIQKYQSDLSFQLEKVVIGDVEQLTDFQNVNPSATIDLHFTKGVNTETIKKSIFLENSDRKKQPIDIIVAENGKHLTLTPRKELMTFEKYNLVIQPTLKSFDHSLIFSGKVVGVSTGDIQTDQFPRISDEELLTLVQKQTFKYFWDFAHPISGMARERSSSDNIVTTGGTGFGVMAIIAAVERQFITREEAVVRLNKIVAFLDEKVEKYHGAYAHWIDGATGKTLPFSIIDDGADLVETALLFQGLLTVRSYFNLNTPAEQQLRFVITKLWEDIDWQFYTRGENQLYWHWSPANQWNMDLKITGWNESLIVYVLAVSSPTYPISPEVYHSGWARNGAMINGKEYYGTILPLGPSLGGPLFLSHYSFLGLDPNLLEDQYANYKDQNVAHTLINRAHAIVNPNNYKGYSNECWGITAGDGNEGYSAFSPTNDKGVITPTAAISSIIYTPKESMDALHYFYYKLGHKIWREYGFIDGFNQTENWVATDYIAINQGPIIISIENHRSGLLWKNFMNIPDITRGLAQLGFN